MLTIALVANSRISLMARGALFLKLMPWTCVRLDIILVFSLPSDANSFYAGSMRIPCAQEELAIRGLHQTERTLLCRWMVYSRATTSSMALRPWAVLPPEAFEVFALLDMVADVGVCVEDLNAEAQTRTFAFGVRPFRAVRKFLGAKLCQRS